MKITIETIPHDQQRIAGQVGDWQWYTPKHLVIRVSSMADRRHIMALAAHEMVEAMLCAVDGVSEEDVDAFDMGFTGEGEPGDARSAPYARQHCFATAVERMLIAAFGLSWAEYEAAVEALP